MLRRKLWRDIRTQWAQFFAVAVTAFLGVALFVSTADAARNLEESYTAAFEEQRFADLTVTGGDLDTLAADAEVTDGVTAIQRRTTADVPVTIDDRELVARVHSLPAGEQPTVNQVKIRSGDYLAEGAIDTVLLERHAAEHFDVGVGDELRLAGAEGPIDLKIGGIVTTPEYFWPARDRQDVFPAPDNFAVVYPSEELAQSLDQGELAEDELLVRFTDRADVDALTEVLSARARELGATAVVPLSAQASNATLRTDINAFGDMAFVFPILFLSAAALTTYVLLTRRVRAERGVIGTMAANGVSRRSLAGHYLSYGLLATAIGALPGIPAGLALGSATTSLYARAIGIPDASASVHLSTVLTALGIGLAVGALAGLAPALWAFHLSPAEAMRLETPHVSGRRSLFERIVPPLRRISASWRMALRGPGRNRRRTAFTVIGVVFSITMMLMSWAMLDSTVEFAEVQYDDVERHDARVYLDGPPTDDTLATIGSVAGVDTVETLPHGQVGLQTGSENYDTILRVYDTDTEMHGFRVIGGSDELPESGVLLGKAADGLLDVDTGDDIEVLLPGAAAQTVTVEGFVDEPLGTFAYMSTAQADMLDTGKLEESTPTLLLGFEDGVDRSAVTATLSRLDGVLAVEDAQLIADLVDDLLAVVYVFVIVMLIFGATMAFALMFAAMSVNVSERATEMVTLRASGMAHSSLARIVSVENAFVAAVGILPGLWLGRRLGEMVMSNYTNDLFAFDLLVTPRTVVVTVVAVMIVTLISQWPGLRAVGRLDIATVARERSL